MIVHGDGHALDAGAPHKIEHKDHGTMRGVPRAGDVNRQVGVGLAAPLLAQYLGGGPASFWGNLMLAFVSAVAFATIVAVVAGLVLASASAMAHDLYVGVVRAGRETTPRAQVTAARVATLIVGAMSIGIGIAAKGQNVAVLVGLAFAVAASANFPCASSTQLSNAANL